MSKTASIPIEGIAPKPPEGGLTLQKTAPKPPEGGF